MYYNILHTTQIHKNLRISIKAWYILYCKNFLLLFQDQNAGKMFADEAAALFERAITTTMKGNMLIYFTYADFEEVILYFIFSLCRLSL